MTHDFDADLARSERLASNEEWWFHLYHRAFVGSGREVVDAWFVTDREQQRLGRDRVVEFDDGSRDTADEKDHWRFPECMELEIWSDVDRRSPGWVLGHKQIDWLTWVVRPERRAYLFPYAEMCAAYHDEKEHWRYLVDLEAPRGQKAAHRVREAKNRGWTTRFLVVPLPEMLRLVPARLTMW